MTWTRSRGGTETLVEPEIAIQPTSIEPEITIKPTSIEPDTVNNLFLGESKQKHLTKAADNESKPLEEYTAKTSSQILMNSEPGYNSIPKTEALPVAASLKLPKLQKASQKNLQPESSTFNFNSINPTSNFFFKDSNSDNSDYLTLHTTLSDSNKGIVSNEFMSDSKGFHDIFPQKDSTIIPLNKISTAYLDIAFETPKPILQHNNATSTKISNKKNNAKKSSSLAHFKQWDDLPVDTSANKSYQNSKISDIISEYANTDYMPRKKGRDTENSTEENGMADINSQVLESSGAKPGLKRNSSADLAINKSRNRYLATDTKNNYKSRNGDTQGVNSSLSPQNNDRLDLKSSIINTTGQMNRGYYQNSTKNSHTHNSNKKVVACSMKYLPPTPSPCDTCKSVL
ncbi:hypothetical protein BB561_004339 [Smittium simulii]|uniref:Uncharacterized protein n=1 Tax=Smittium simulii TaxID=133385 RepID=A0A2T9YH10_9FUNG|nr:hypothetical protein BB561_004339 [Smittium simulii]